MNNRAKVSILLKVNEKRWSSYWIIFYRMVRIGIKGFRCRCHKDGCAANFGWKKTPETFRAKDEFHEYWWLGEVGSIYLSIRQTWEKYRARNTRILRKKRTIKSFRDRDWVHVVLLLDCAWDVGQPTQLRKYFITQKIQVWLVSSDCSSISEMRFLVEFSQLCITHVSYGSLFW